MTFSFQVAHVECSHFLNLIFKKRKRKNRCTRRVVHPRGVRQIFEYVFPTFLRFLTISSTIQWTSGVGLTNVARHRKSLSD